MPFADDLRLRGRGDDRQRAFAHQCGQHVPAIVGRELQQRFIDCRKGEIGTARGFPIGRLHLHIDLRNIAGGVARPVGLDRDLQLMRFPADLHLGDADAVARLGEIDQSGRFLPLGRIARQADALRDAVQPRPEAAFGAPAHDHDRDEHVGRIASRHLHFDHRIGPAEFGDVGREHALALDRDQSGRLAERHPHLEARGVACLVRLLLGDDVHAIAIVASEPPIVLARQPHALRRARFVTVGILGDGHRIDFARNTGGELAIRQPLRIGRGRAGLRELGGLHAIVVRIEAADQPPPRGEDLAAVERDRDRLVGDRLAIGVECHEPQPQIVLLHQPAVGLDAQLHAAGIDRDALGRGQHFAIGVLIIHLDQHVGRAVEALRDAERLLCGAVSAQRRGEHLRRRQRGLLLLAVTVERSRALGNCLAAEAIALIAVGLRVMPEIADAHIDREVRGPPAREIADEQVERQRRRADHRFLRAGHARAHRRQLEFVDLEALPGLDPAIVGDHRKIVIAHWRAGRSGPFVGANTVRIDAQRQIELRVGSAMLQPQRTGNRRRQAEARAHRRAQDVLHMHRLALPDQRGIEHGVECLAACRIAIGQVEIVRPDALAPFGQREAEIVADARRDHQRRLAIFAIAIGFGRGQAGGRIDSTTLVGRAMRETLAGATVGDPHRRARDGLAGVERGHPGEALLAAPFEMHRHVGDERGGGDIARGFAPEQRLPQHGARQFDDVEAGLAAAERHPDDFEILAFAGQPDLERRTLFAEDRGRAGVVDRHRFLAAFLLMAVILPGLVDRAQPFGDRAVGAIDAERLSGDRQVLALQRRFDVAHRHRQHAALLRFENAESRGELH